MKRTKINEKEAGIGPYYLSKNITKILATWRLGDVHFFFQQASFRHHRSSERDAERRRRGRSHRRSGQSKCDLAVGVSLHTCSIVQICELNRPMSFATKIRNITFRTSDYRSVWPDLAPLWKYFKSPGHFCKGLFCVWPNSEPTLAILYDIGSIFSSVNSQVWTNNLAIWSHCYLFSVCLVMFRYGLALGAIYGLF